ncbi:MAG: hypothetical protein ACFFB0_02695 [Promethearchaeota archaeon]
MGVAYENLTRIIDKMNTLPKAQQVFVTDIGGKPVNWEMTFQFNLDNEDPFYLKIKDQKTIITQGILSSAEIVISGENLALVRICEGKGDFTHAISREQITVDKGKVMDIIRLTRAITLVLKTK